MWVIGGCKRVLERVGGEKARDKKRKFEIEEGYAIMGFFFFFGKGGENRTCHD